jgi:O-Antigen ligase
MPQPSETIQVPEEAEGPPPQAPSSRGSRKRRRRMQPRADQWVRRLQDLPLEHAATWLVGGTFAVAVLAVGAVHIPVMLVVGAMATLTLVVSLLLGFDEDRSLAITWPAVFCWALAGFSLLQLIPLPVALVEVIAPTNADVWSRALLPFGETVGGWVPISLDPGATWVEALRWYSYGAIFTGMSVVASYHGARWGLSLVFGLGVAAAAITLVHGLLGLRQVYGLYQPSFQAQPWHVGPLLNPNNLAGLLNLSALCGLGLIASERSPLPRPLLALGTALLVAVDVSSASRGGVVALGVGLVGLAIAIEVLRRRRGGLPIPVRRLRIGIASSLLAGVLLAVLGMKPAAWKELLSKNVEKIEHIATVESAIRDFAWVGMGRGSFESVFPAYQKTPGNVVYTHAENFVAHWSAEWGLPIALAALLAFGFVFRPRRLGANIGVSYAAAWVGVAVLLLQNLVDLGLEVPALCLAIAVVCGSLWGGQGRGRYHPAISKRGAKGWQTMIAVGLATLMGVGTLAGSALVGRHDIASDRKSMRAGVLGGARPRAPEQVARINHHLKKAMTRHPADPYFPLLGALVASDIPGGNPIPWLQRSLERSLMNARAHLLLAQVLHRIDALDQSLLELRLAQESDPHLIPKIAALGVTWSNDPKVLAAMVPQGELAARGWDALGGAAKDRTLGAACDNKALELAPDRAGPHLRLAMDRVTDARSQEGRCHDERQACADEVEAHAVVVERTLPRTAAAAVLRARWLAATGEGAKADELLERACDDVRDYVACHRARAEIVSALDDAERFVQVGKELRAAACQDADRCAEVTTWIGDLHMGRSEFGSAVAAYERALRDAASEERLLKLAKAAKAAGLKGKAMRAYERVLRRRGGHDAGIEEEIQTLRGHVVREVLQR